MNNVVRLSFKVFFLLKKVLTSLVNSTQNPLFFNKTQKHTVFRAFQTHTKPLDTICARMLDQGP